MAQSEISIQVRTSSAWGAISGSVSGLGPWDPPSVPVPWQRDPSSVVEQSATPYGGPPSASEEGLPDHAMVAISAVLSAWRGVERELNWTPVGSPQWQRLSAYLDAMRDTYHRLFDEIRRRAPLY